MRCDEAQELITARVDNELSADERVAIDAHLKTCADCTRAFEQESVLKRQLHLSSQAIAAPLALRAVIESKIASRESKPAGRLVSWFAGFTFTWRPALALAVVLIVAASLLYVKWPAPNVGMAALATHQKILSGKTNLVRSNNPVEVRRQLARAVGERFQPVALDFSMMKLYPVAGFVERIGGREVLVTVYQGDGPAITCFTFLGSETDAPAGAEKFYDADMRLNFYSFSRDGVNGVLHQEGGVICMLVSKMTAADLLALLRGKSAHA
jgi:anti-sigma factor RsiW